MLVLSEIRMLRDFGLVTVIDLGVALIGVLVVLPAVLMLAESGALRRRLNIEMPSHYHHHPDKIAVFPSIFVEQA